jgi:transcriptional regulator with XRE-family HTH domain
MKIDSKILLSEVSLRLNQAFQKSSFKNVTGIAKATGIAKSDLSGYFNGNHLPKCENLIALCAALNVSIDWLLKGEGNEQMRIKKVADYIQQNVESETDLQEIKKLLDTDIIVIPKSDCPKSKKRQFS